MQVFELHFNPKVKENLIFDSFCYEPENIYEKKLGNLYIAGELQNALPQNSRFLDNLAKILKEKYYGLSLKSSEKAFSESIKGANEFLATLAKNGNVSWLGNLNFATLSLTSQQRWWGVNFTKVGNLKILLSRDQNLIDIGKNLDLEEIPEPLKIFSNLVSGKLTQDDKIMILTKEVFSAFTEGYGGSSENLLNKIAKTEVLDEKKLKEIFKKSEKELKDISGIFLLVQLKPEIQPKYTLTFKKKVPEISFSQIFLPILKRMKAVGLKRQTKFLKTFLSLVKKIRPSKLIRGPKIFLRTFSKISSLPDSIKQNLRKPILKKGLILTHPPLKKRAGLILILILILLAGFFIFKGGKEEEIRQTQEILDEVEAKIIQAENFLILKEEEKTNSLYQEAWSLLLPQTKTGAPLEKKALFLKNSIEDKLYSLNKLEKIAELQLASDQNLFQQKKSQTPDSPFPFDDFSKFKSYIYFLDSNKGEIQKCSSPLIQKNCEFWLSPETKKPIEAKSMAIDGSIWILTKENQIDRYYNGSYQETLSLNFFPCLEDPIKIWTSKTLSYLYLLEPGQNRIIILNKSGEIVKQFQSEKLDNLLDFALSEDGKTIYLLNGLKIYQLSAK